MEHWSISLSLGNDLGMTEEELEAAAAQATAVTVLNLQYMNAYLALCKRLPSTTE